MALQPIRAGEPAPEFTLKNHGEGDVKLTAFAEIGRRVLLSFHPLAWTTVCEIQMMSLEVKQSALDELDTTAVGISVDPVPCKKSWAEMIGVEKTDLLSDFWPHGEVAKQYGLFLEDKGISGRANVLVGADGKVELVKVYEILEIPDIEEIIRFIKENP